MISVLLLIGVGAIALVMTISLIFYSVGMKEIKQIEGRKIK